MAQIKIHEITKEFYHELSQLKGWQETPICSGEAVEAHSHEFDAMYFTEGVRSLYSSGKKVDLPALAAVFIPKGSEHAWSGVAQGIKNGRVGHFHPGHGIHKIVAEY